jgi:hypothetical protein
MREPAGGDRAGPGARACLRKPFGRLPLSGGPSLAAPGPRGRCVGGLVRVGPRRGRRFPGDAGRPTALRSGGAPDIADAAPRADGAASPTGPGAGDRKGLPGPRRSARWIAGALEAPSGAGPPRSSSYGAYPDDSDSDSGNVARCWASRRDEPLRSHRTAPHGTAPHRTAPHRTGSVPERAVCPTASVGGRRRRPGRVGSGPGSGGAMGTAAFGWVGVRVTVGPAGRVGVQAPFPEVLTGRRCGDGRVGGRRGSGG